LSEAHSLVTIGPMKRILMVWTVLAGLPGLAAAQSADPVFDPLTMDRLTPLSTLAVDLGYEVFDEPDGSDYDVLSLNLAGHFVGRQGLGGYVTIPLSYLNVDLNTPIGNFNDSDLVLGNIEAGGLLTKYFGNIALLFHAGIALPTASDEDGVAGLQPYASYTRFGDLVQRIPDSTWLRLGMSPMGRTGILFWRADVGIDLALDDDSTAEISPVLRLNVGGGVDLGSAVLIAELVNVITDPEDNRDDSAATFSLGARFQSGNLRPGVALVLPVDFDDDFVDFDFALVGSLAIRI
jgi:hypothetical protein